MSTPRRAVILVSGGLDSTTVLAMAREQGFACYTLSFDYGQRHRAELHAAERVSVALGDVAHKVVKLNLDSIVQQVASHAPRYVTVTGGEPLAQPNCLPLLTMLCDCGYEVSLETSGAMSVAGVDPRVVKVLDLKTPASAEMERNDYGNIALLNPGDQVKFVICDRADYEWARFKLDEHQLAERVSDILFSPSHGQVSGRELAEWILADNLQVRLQLQLHKLLWNDEPGH